MNIRRDGRRPNELRQVVLTPNFIVYPEGSVLITVGQTKVLCSVTIESGVPRWMTTQGLSGGWITGEYGMLPRSTHIRTPRETSGLSGRTQEIRRLIGRSLRAAVDLSHLGERTIIVDCDVIQADGGTRTAAITGGYVALAIALKGLVNTGVLPIEVIRTAVAAVSVGMVKDIPVLDLCYEEDSSADVDFNIVMNREGEYIEIQGTAENKSFPRDTLEELLGLASKGILELFDIQKACLENI